MSRLEAPDYDSIDPVTRRSSGPAPLAPGVSKPLPPTGNVRVRHLVGSVSVREFRVGGRAASVTRRRLLTPGERFNVVLTDAGILLEPTGAEAPTANLPAWLKDRTRTAR